MSDCCYRLTCTPCCQNVRHSSATNRTDTLRTNQWLSVPHTLPDFYPRKLHLSLSDWHVVGAMEAASLRPATDTFDFCTLTRFNWNTHTHIYSHTSIPCGIRQGLLGFTGWLPVYHSACLSPSVHIWMNNTRADVQHTHWSTDTVHYTPFPSLHQWGNTILFPWWAPLQAFRHLLWWSCTRWSL